MSQPTAVVTGASSGIGAATARVLADAGFRVFLVARRSDRVEALAAEIGGVAVPADLTVAADVARLADVVGETLDLVVNNAGGARGADPVATGKVDDWRTMYEINVISTLQVTQALLPALVASGGGTIINMGSIAGHVAYEGGAGYTAAKHAVAVMTETLRLELNGLPVRVTEIAPGMVHTEEFSLNRLGDKAKADAVYRGVAHPLVADDIAEAVRWVATLPSHVNIDLISIKPRAQAAPHKVHREG